MYSERSAIGEITSINYAKCTSNEDKLDTNECNFDLLLEGEDLNSRAVGFDLEPIEPPLTLSAPADRQSQKSWSFCHHHRCNEQRHNNNNNREKKPLSNNKQARAGDTAFFLKKL